MRALIIPWLVRFASGLRFPQLFALIASLFVVDLIVPDMIPFADEILLDTEDRMSKAVDNASERLKGIRTGRASPGLVEGLRIDYYGSPTPLKQVANISVPEPRLLVIKPFDPSAIGDIEKAILKSEIGITPMSDGKVIRLPVPALSEEQRKKYVAKVKELCEETRVALRNTRRDLNKHSDAMEKSSELTQDDNRKLHDEIQKLLKEAEGNVDVILEKKTKEVTEL